MDFKKDESNIDYSILKFLHDVQLSENASQWKFFIYFLENASAPSSGLTYFEIKNLQNPYKLKFLDRVKIQRSTDDTEYRYGTVIGEHQGDLYINLDTQFYATKFIEDVMIISKESSGKTNFESTLHFKNLYLGFYILLHARFYIKAEAIFSRQNELRTPHNRLIFWQNHSIDFFRNHRDFMWLQADLSEEIIQTTQLNLKLKPPSPRNLSTGQ